MKSMLLLKKLRISNANAISGLTWGFPAITHFLGFTHALSRFTQQSCGVTLQGCGVICHQVQHKTQTNAYGRHSFALTRNPLTRKGETAPFNEEGKMHLTVSLVIDADFDIYDLEDGVDAEDVCESGEAAYFQNLIETKINTMRLAGGLIESVEKVELITSDDEINGKDLRKTLRQLLPGFALVDRSPLLQNHFLALQTQNPDVTMLDAWLDFAAIKYAPVREDTPLEQEESSDANPDAKSDIQWQYQAKPGSGYLVPITVGYKGVSPLYNNDEVKSTRDDVTPVRFVESAYGVGQWLSPHRISNSNDLLWRYQQQDDWYLCRNAFQPETETPDDIHTNNQ